MIIGVLTIELEIAAAESLKDKRRVLNKIKDRVRRKFNVSIAEVEGNDLLNYGCLGVAIVTNERRFANTVLSSVVTEIEQVHECVLADYSLEFIRSRD